MYYIADTHAFLWYLMDSPKLSKRAREVFDAYLVSKDRIIKKYYQRTIW